MADTSGLITIKNVVDGFMFKTRADSSDFKLLYQLACEALIELNLWVLEDGRNLVKLNMTGNDIYIVDLPDDYLKFIAIGVPVNGKLVTLTRDNGIITTTTESGGAETLDSDYGEGVDINSSYGYTYGATGGRNTDGYYKIDEANRRIVFRNVTKTEVFLEYVSSGLSLDSETYIPAIAKRAMESYMMWEFYKYKIDFPESKIARYESDYINRKSELIGLTLPTMSELADVWYEGMHQSIRR